ncbi:MAG: histidine kinase [Verrucomicrobiota bacterium]
MPLTKWRVGGEVFSIYPLRIVFGFLAMLPLWLGGELRAEESPDGSLSYRIARNVRGSIQENERTLKQLRSRRDQLAPLAPGRHGESLGFHSRFQEDVEDPLEILIDLGRLWSVDRIAFFPISTVFQGETIGGYGFPPRFQLEASESANFGNATLVYKSSDADEKARPEYPVQVLTPGLSTRYLKLQVLEHWKRPDGRVLTALGEIMVLSGNQNLSLGAFVEADSFTSLPDWSSASLMDGQTDLGLPVRPEPSASNGYLARPAPSPQSPKWVQVELSEAARIDEVRLLPTQPLDAPSQYGHGFPRRFRVLASNDRNFKDYRVIADRTKAWFPNPGDNPVILPGDGQPARYVRLEAVELWHITNNSYSLALSEMQVYESGVNVAMGSKVRYYDIGGIREPFSRYWNEAFLVDGFSSQNRLIELDEWLDDLEERKALDLEIGELEAENQRLAESTVAGLLASSTATVGTLAILFVFNLVRRRRMLLAKQRELRDRISRDLHDDLGSRLGGMRLLSESLLSDPDLAPAVREDIDIICRASGEANHAMRDIVWLLDNNESSRAKLVAHMRQLAPSGLGHMEHEFHFNEAPEQLLDFEFRRQVLFSYKECLTNVIKHADAKTVFCSLGGDEKRFTFEVRDDGKGFKLEDAKLGHGIGNLTTRANSIGGSVRIESQLGEGTQVIFEAPIRLRRK